MVWLSTLFCGNLVFVFCQCAAVYQYNTPPQDLVEVATCMIVASKLVSCNVLSMPLNDEVCRMDQGLPVLRVSVSLILQVVCVCDMYNNYNYKVLRTNVKTKTGPVYRFNFQGYKQAALWGQGTPKEDWLKPSQSQTSVAAVCFSSLWLLMPFTWLSQGYRFIPAVGFLHAFALIDGYSRLPVR